MAATTVTLHTTTADVVTVVTALCANFNYAQNGGGLTQSQFALQQLAGWLQTQVQQYNQAQQQAAGNAAIAAAAANQASLSLTPYNPLSFTQAITASSP